MIRILLLLACTLCKEQQRTFFNKSTPLMKGEQKTCSWLTRFQCKVSLRESCRSQHNTHAPPLAFGKRTPKARFNLLMMAPFGIALPDSYSLMTVPFSFIAVAKADPM